MKKAFFQKKNVEKNNQDLKNPRHVVKNRWTEKKVVRFLDGLTDRILILFCIILLFLGGYALLDTIHVYNHANDKSLLTYKPKVDKDGTVRDPLSLPGSVGWLTLDGSNVDYPIMQGTDNNAYLNKDPYGNYSLSGSLFLDASNSPDFTDQYSMIYGHHMEHNSMFGTLDEYLKPEYFAEHRSGSIIIKDKSYKLVLFAALECSAYQKEIFDVTYGGALDYIRENAEIFYGDDVTEYDQILAMSTCQEADSDQRTIIFAVIVGGPGSLNADGSQKSTTSGDVNTGTTGNRSNQAYLYWLGLFTAFAIGVALLLSMKKDKKKLAEQTSDTFTIHNSEIVDATYSTINGPNEESPNETNIPERGVSSIEEKHLDNAATEPVEVPEIKLIEMSKAASVETKEPEAKTPAKKKPARKPRKKTSDTVTAKTAEKPKRKAATKKSVKPVAVEVAPVEKTEVAPIIEKPKRKTTKKTAKPAEVAVAPVEKPKRKSTKKTVKIATVDSAPSEQAEITPVVEKPKRKSTKKTVKPAAVESAPVEKTESAPIAAKPKRKTTKKTAKPATVEAPVEKTEVKSVVEKPKRKSTKKTAKLAEVAVATVEKTEDAPVVEKPKRKPAKKAVKPAIVEAPIEKVEAKPTVEKPKRKTTRKAAGKAVEPAPVEKIEAAPVVEKPKRKAPVKKKTVKSADKTVDQPKVKRTRKASTAIDAKKEAAKQPEKKPVVRKKKASATTEKKPAKTAKKKIKPVNNNGEQ